MSLNPKDTSIQPQIQPVRPEILAPAGDRKSFLAAIAAGADAVYCGLKHFSARMAAQNFTIDELSPLTRLAHDRRIKVYITINSIIKPDELDQAGKLLDQLNRSVNPDGLIIADLALLGLARQAGFKGDIHLSTLANVSFPSALRVIARFPEVKRVVLPRELNIDEIKAAAKNCPDELSLEVFVHGALCYGVSGRCYWSSYLGGKSGLRGRCVQPCRRIYQQKGERKRFFSCNDLWTDVLTKVLISVPQIAGIKIEGRKKGPHYVYYTVAAYKLLRDGADDPKMKKVALSFLEYALGRKGTHYNFLPQRPQNPIDVNIQTGSGMLVGKVTGSSSKPYIHPRIELLPNDLLRVGYEEDAFHATHPVRNYISKKTKFYLKLPGKIKPRAGTPVFLIDRQESELYQQMAKLEIELTKFSKIDLSESHFKAKLPKKRVSDIPPIEMTVVRNLKDIKITSGVNAARWLSVDDAKLDNSGNRNQWFWLPPVIWPDDENKWKKIIDRALAKRCTQFVLNAPWQIVFFPKQTGLNLWAGPFCNIANPLSIEKMKAIGFSGVIVSPELAEKDYALLAANSVLPLGIVYAGNWPLCVSRTISDQLHTRELFASPKGEHAWAARYGPDVWVFPNWEIDLSEKKETLQKYGYQLFVRLKEPMPKQIQLKKRPGIWNWRMGLK